MLEMLAGLGNWLLNYLLHSSLLIAGLWGLERAGLLNGRLAPWREQLWRWALFGALLTASLQPLLAWSTQAAVSPPQGIGLAAIEPSAEPAAELAAAPEPAGPGRPGALPQGSSQGNGNFNRDSQGSAHAAWAALTLAWLLLGLGGLLLTLARWLHLRRLARRLPAITDPELLSLAARQASLAGLRRPSLRSSPLWASPVLLPGGAICLPAWALQQLDSGQLEAVLGHEIAHLRRRDPAWRLAGQLLLSLAWLQPLNRLALRRLDSLAELACDDWAARHDSARLALAESLYACAQAVQTRRRRMPALGAAMVAGEHSLLQRIQTLLEKPAMTSPEAPARRRLHLFAGISVLGLALSLPVLGLVRADNPGWQALGDWAGQLLEGGTHTRMNERGPRGSLSIHISGTLAFNEDQDELLRISGGSLVIDENRDGLRRRASFRPGDNGIQRSYAVDGREQAPDAAGRLWLAEKIGEAAELVQGSGARVQRLLRQGGSERVLADIAAARSEHLMRGRSVALLQLGPQSRGTLEQLLQLSRKMDSSYERGQSLQAMVRHQQLDEALQRELLQALDGVGSDFERRQVLDTLAPKLGQEAATLQAWVQALAGTDSDFEKRSVLVAWAAGGRLSPAQLDAALQASLQLSSGFEQRAVLESLARHLGAAGPATVQAYAASARRIGSDFERRNALLALLNHAPRVPSSFEAVLDGMAGMDSSFERRSVLSAVAALMPADDRLLRRYRQQARGLDDFDRGQAEQALDHLQPAG